jgi:hypothetical protein
MATPSSVKRDKASTSSSTRSDLCPRNPRRAVEPEHTHTTEEAIIIEDSDNGSSTSSSDWDNETHISEPWLSSPLHTPQAPRHTRHGNWHEGGVESSVSAIDSMAQLAERGQALRAQADGVQARQRGVRARHTESKQGERDRRQQILSLRHDYERRVEQFREEMRAELSSASALQPPW